MNRHIFTFKPIFKPTLWGGSGIARYKDEAISQSNIGESWEISAVPGHESVGTDGPDEGESLSELCRKYGAELLGNNSIKKYGNVFPLLVKIIDAKDDLSVQVHPNDELARRRHNSFGKTEMWYIVETENNSTILCGFAKHLDADRLGDAVARGEFKGYLANHKSSPGDCFFIPAGRVHSIGSGNLLVEIQQSSDITYRIDDFNRRDADGNLRELHLDLAKEAIDYSVKADYMTHYIKEIGQPDNMVDCQYFNTDILYLEPAHEIALKHIDSFRIIVCTEGEITLDAGDSEPTILKKGHSALIAASAKSVSIKSTKCYSTILLCNV